MARHSYVRIAPNTAIPSQKRKRDVGHNIMDLGRTRGDRYRGDSVEVAFDAMAAIISRSARRSLRHLSTLYRQGLDRRGILLASIHPAISRLVGTRRWDITCSIE